MRRSAILAVVAQRVAPRSAALLAAGTEVLLMMNLLSAGLVTAKRQDNPLNVPAD